MSTKAQNGKSRMVYFRCPHDTYEDFRLWAIDKNTSIAALIYSAMTGWLNAEGIPPPDPSIALAAEKEERQRIQKLKDAIDAGMIAREDYIPPEAMTAPDDYLLALIDSLPAKTEKPLITKKEELPDIPNDESAYPS